MPSVAAIVWSGIASLILLMLAIIGFLIRTGFEGLKRELKILWEKIDLHQSAATANALAIREINARCEERHANHRRASDR